MYKPLTFNRRQMTMVSRDQNQSQSFMAKGGVDLRDLAQLLDPTKALKIRNFYLVADGGLTKRKGISKLFEEAGGVDSITLLDKYTDDIYLYAYATTLKAYRVSTGGKTTIKSDFKVDVTNGARYGDYYFVASHGDKIGRVSMTLPYDTKTANFTAGLLLTGATSGATAIILEDSNSGAAGTLTLGSVDGVFQDNEIITDSSTGSAAVNGTLGFAYNVVTAAPIASVIKAIGARLYVGNLLIEPGTVQYSDTDTGSNPPFTDWSVATTATSGGKLMSRNSGAVNAIEPLGNNVMVFCDEGKMAWQQSTIDSGGTLTKVDTLVMDRKDFGGSRGVLNTQKGLFYVNEAGLWQLRSIGQSNVPFSDQEGLATLLLGTEYFKDIDLSNADMAYDKQKNTLLIACARNSTGNNLVIAYNVDQEAVSEFSGWDISRFMLDNETIFAGGDGATKVWKVFDGYSDDGKDVWYEIYQELHGGALESRQELLGTYVQGILSPSSSPTISYDIYDRQGNFVDTKMSQTWTPTTGGNLNGWGGVSWGSPFGGDVDVSNLTETFSGARDVIRNWQRIRVKISGHDQLPMQINWIKLLTRRSMQIRRRNLAKN